MFRKLLVANRGEIVVRALRAAYELGIDTVAVYAWEDRASMHRQKASEAYEIGTRGRPVHAHLDIDEIVRVARESGADAVYPGYGFLAENPLLADACKEAGLVFVGPRAATLRLTGEKIRALAFAEETGLPVLRRSDVVSSGGDAVGAAETIGYPLFVKATAGGGGRGMRRVETADDLPAAMDAASREAESAFGDPTVFLEEAIERPRHVEVQVLGDAAGSVVHLFERDCSIQRRHQKMVELAPAPGLDVGLRDTLLADATRYAAALGYVNAGTVEFLLDPSSGRHVFLEMNPRIQVEHTVTEETTDVDLVQTQLRIAGGATLAELGLTQDSIVQRGAALQCRITTEDPANGFRPDTGRVSVYRSPGGAGVRLDGGTTYAGAEVSGFYDSMLVKLTCRGHDWATAVGRARRALAEFRIRGVATNITFLQAVMDDPDLLAGRLSTAFIDERPDLLSARRSTNRAMRLVDLVAQRTIERPYGEPTGSHNPSDRLAATPAGRGARGLAPAARGARSRALRGSAESAAAPRGHRHDVPRRSSVATRNPH